MAATGQSPTIAVYHTAVQQLYVGYFGRPADPAGLVNFSNALAAANAPTTVGGLTAAYAANNLAIRTLIESFGSSQESAALYSGNTAAFVTSIYANIFNRAPDAEGLGFWTRAIDSGALSKANAAASLMGAAASNTTAQGKLDAVAVAHKAEIAGLFTAELDATGSTASYAGDAAAAAARAMLTKVSFATVVSDFMPTVSSTVSKMAGHADAPAATIPTAPAAPAAPEAPVTPQPAPPASDPGAPSSGAHAGESATGNPIEAPVFVLHLDTGASNSDRVTRANAVDVTLASNMASWEYSLDHGASWSTGSGVGFHLVDDTRYAIGDIQVRQRDTASHVSAAAINTGEITTDTFVLAPDYTINDIGVSNVDGITQDNRVNVALANDVARWEFSLDNGAHWSVGSGSTFQLVANTYYDYGAVQVRQLDAAGNLSLASANSIPMLVDFNAPGKRAIAVSYEDGGLGVGNYDVGDIITLHFSEGVSGFTAALADGQSFGAAAWVLADDGMSASLILDAAATLNGSADVKLVGVVDMVGNSADLVFNI